MERTNWTAITMTVLTVTVGLACAVLALTLAKDDVTAKALLFGAAGTALGSFLKQPQNAGKDKAPTASSTALVLAFVALASGGTLAASCAHTTPGQFRDAVVTCTMENSNNAQALAAVGNCLTGAIAGNYVACLSGLVSAGHWTVDEIACVVRKLATESAQRINADLATGTDWATLDNANQWLKDNNIRFK